MGLLEADYVGGIGERDDVSDDPFVSGVLAGLIGVVGEGVKVMEDNPRVRDGRVEGACRTADLVRRH